MPRPTPRTGERGEIRSWKRLAIQPARWRAAAAFLGEVGDQPAHPAPCRRPVTLEAPFLFGRDLARLRRRSVHEVEGDRLVGSRPSALASYASPPCPAARRHAPAGGNTSRRRPRPRRRKLQQFARPIRISAVRELESGGRPGGDHGLFERQRQRRHQPSTPAASPPEPTSAYGVAAPLRYSSPASKVPMKCRARSQRIVQLITRRLSEPA